MHWTEPATSDDSHAELEKKLWDAANQLWAGASLKPSEYSPTVRFVEAHQKNPTAKISVHGQDQWAWGTHLRRAQRARRVRQRRKLPNQRVTDATRLARLNLAVHGLSGDIKQGNTYYEDLQDSVGRFDFVLANPPFNVSKINKERLAGDPRYPFGIPCTDNGNFLWIQHFQSALNKKGRAGFVMANSAADARASFSRPEHCKLSTFNQRSPFYQNVDC